MKLSASTIVVLFLALLGTGLVVQSVHCQDVVSALTDGAPEPEDPVERGLAIAKTADAMDSGWVCNRSVSKMTLQNRHGQTSEREMRRLSLEVQEEGAGDKSIVVFDSPKDIDGTALLSHTRVLEPDNQWLYLPALKRVKRISSSNKSGPFVGSEFAYEDLLSQEVGKYSYKYLREETLGELDCAVVERIPLYENSGYTRQIVWWDREEYRVQKVEFYDRKNALLKTLTYTGYQEYLGEFWRADRMEMVNHQTGKQTSIVFESWKFDVGLTDRTFTPSKLKRIR